MRDLDSPDIENKKDPLESAYKPSLSNPTKLCLSCLRSLDRSTIIFLEAGHGIENLMQPQLELSSKEMCQIGLYPELLEPRDAALSILVIGTSEHVVRVSAARFPVHVLVEEVEEDSHCSRERPHEDVGPGFGEEGAVVEGEVSVDLVLLRRIAR
jgi:hypothetical protein